MDNVNDLTLQLLLNQKNYNKLVKQKRAETCEEDIVVDKVKENKSEIIDTIIQLIDGEVDDLNNTIILAFDDFTNELFKHWDMLKIRDINKFYDSNIPTENNEDEEHSYDDEPSSQTSKIEDNDEYHETTSVWSSEKVLKFGK